jgi:hypothetical protein
MRSPASSGDEWQVATELRPAIREAHLARRFLLCLASAIATHASAEVESTYSPVPAEFRPFPGLADSRHFDLRYESIDRDRLRPATSDAVRARDEVRTRSRQIVATYSQAFANGWGHSIALPLVDRDHAHTHHATGTPVTSHTKVRGIGDVRAIGRYQWPLGSLESPAAAGVLGGLKLATGRKLSDDERDLDPGSGTTDLIVGGFYRQHLSFGTWQAHAHYARPLSRRDGYRPGAVLAADLTAIRPLTDKLAASLQLTFVRQGRDRDATGSSVENGSRSIYLSPGLSYAWTPGMRIYGIYQHPLHQDFDSLQLTANRAVVIGVQTRF